MSFTHRRFRLRNGVMMLGRYSGRFLGEFWCRYRYLGRVGTGTLARRIGTLGDIIGTLRFRCADSIGTRVGTLVGFKVLFWVALNDLVRLFVGL